LGENCFVSFNSTDFVLAFSNSDLNFDVIITLLSGNFDIASNYSEGIFTLDEKSFYGGQYGNYIVISSIPIEAEYTEDTYQLTNADYMVMVDSVSVDRYILANDRQFKVWNETSDPVRGNPMAHEAFVKKIPVSFSTAHFYGSQRMLEDKNSFFASENEEEFSWIGDGLLILKKDSFELMIATQNDQRDLRLILEEQTLKANDDTIQIPFFNVKSFEIMPFETDFKWRKAIPELKSDLSSYAEYENFNVMSNSIAAMRWYLSEIQTGNLIGENRTLMEQYRISTPLKCHAVHLANTDSGNIYETETWMSKTVCTHTTTTLNLISESNSSNESLMFEAPFKPLQIIPIADKPNAEVILVGEKKIAV
jgi:hypothetical protein